MHPRPVAPRPTRLWIALLALLVAWALSCKPQSERSGAGRETKAEAPAEALFSPAELADAIALAAGYLRQNCRETGQFVYRRHLDPSRRYSDKYNMLRHAGTVYALSMYYERSGDAKTLDVMARAADYLRTRIRPVGGADDVLAMWSPANEITGKDRHRPPLAKLGGAGLALVALTALERAKKGSAPLEELRGLARFIVLMQKDDGSFYSKHYQGEGPDDHWTSLYYPGEAMLGLLRLHDLDPDAQWLDAAAKGMAYLAKSRADDGDDVPPDHWALLATEKLLAKYDAVAKPPASRGEIVAHAAQLCRMMMDSQVHDATASACDGALTRDGRTCPSATRLEGLQAALTFLPAENEPLRQRIRIAAERGIAFLVRSQVRTGPLQGALPYKPLALARAAEEKDVRDEAGEVRIDYVQHALSAMIQQEALSAEAE